MISFNERNYVDLYQEELERIDKIEISGEKKKNKKMINREKIKMALKFEK